MPEIGEGKSGHLTRRGFVQVIGAAAVTLAVRRCSPEGKALGFAGRRGTRTTFITPNGDFYLVAVDPSFTPRFGLDTVERDWRLALEGPGGARQDLSYGMLRGLPSWKVFKTFECIGNDVGGDLIGNAEWRVVPLKTLLEPLRTAGVNCVRFEALDDFYSSVSAARAFDEQAFLAYEMNGEPLPAGHGFPARVLLPDLYGMKQPRWLKRIVLQETSATTSFWEVRGWAGDVPVKTMSRIDRGTIAPNVGNELCGIAYAGNRGIMAVEVSLDGGKTWEPCRLATGTAANVWSLWTYTWRSPTKGRYRVLVRATDGRGERQTAAEQGAYPDGASGYHALSFKVG